MFGFFKSKNKDKTNSKDKVSESSKEKKKEKGGKDTKNKDVKDNVTLRNKEDKSSLSSKSIFRKSRSIERNKEKEVEGSIIAKKRSKTLEPPRRSGGDWDDSSHDTSVRSSAATDEESSSGYGHGEEATIPKYPIMTGASSGTSPEHTMKCHGGSAGEGMAAKALVASIHNSESAPQSKAEDISLWETNVEGKCETVVDEEINKINVTGTVTPSVLVNKHDFTTTNPVSHNISLKPDREEIWNEVKKAASSFTTPKRSDEGTMPLAMKPPLNPRIIGPRGPLAASGFPLTSGITNINQDTDDSRFTPSPGVATPPSSPGLSGSQGIPPYPIVTGPSSRPTSPDGRASMLSTPSSSTSSLSSLTARPISPSGRRTPPGPRMGTGGRLSSSPTAGRKAVRTNIKTNPVVALRRGGSQSPINPVSSGAGASEIPFMDGDRLITPPSSPIAVRHLQIGKESTPCNTELHSSASEATSLVTTSNDSASPKLERQLTVLDDSKASLASSSVKPKVTAPPSPVIKVCFPVEPKVETVKQGTRSVSPTAVKSRHSISSVHSLESIPENDSDSQASANNTLEKNKGTVSINYKSLDPLAAMREHNKVSKILSGYSARHSAPEAPSSDPHLVVSPTHKRSSSLTPVCEEKPTQIPIAEISELKNNPSKNIFASTAAQAKIHNESINGAVACLGSAALEKTKGKNDKNTLNTSEKRIRGEQRTLYNNHSGNLKDEPSLKKKKNNGEHPKANDMVGKAKQSGSFLLQSENAVSAAQEEMSLQNYEEDTVKGVFSINKDVNENQDSRETERVDSMVEGKDASNSQCSIEDDLKSSDFSADENSTSQMATHVVFRIPLKSNSFTNSHEMEKRVSVEILSGKEAREVNRPEKDCHKERPRSLSTSHELKRERNSESFHRKRSSSSGPERENSRSTKSKIEEEKDQLRERIRRRSSSSSSSSRRSLRSRANNQNCEKELSELQANKENIQGSNEEVQVVVIPWRRRNRSHSRVRDASGSVADQEDSKRAASPTDSLNTTRPSRTRLGSVKGQPGQREMLTQGTTTLESKAAKICNDSTDLQAQVSRPLRRRSSSREAERRMTRSITLSDLKREKDDTEQTSGEKESACKRRAQSSSRIRETSQSKPTEDEDLVRRPPRRRSLSNSRKSSSNNHEIIEVAIAKEKQTKTTNSTCEDEKEVGPSSENDKAEEEPGNEIEEHQKIFNNSLNLDIIQNSNENEVTQNGETDVKVEATVRIRRRSSSRNTSSSNQQKEPEEQKKQEVVDIDVIKSTDDEDARKFTDTKQTQTIVSDETLVLDVIEDRKKELAAQEERYQKQVDHLTHTLAEKQEEVQNLTQRLEDLRGAKDRLNDSEQLQLRLDTLQKELREKAVAMDSVKVELQYSKNEAELTKSRLKKLEEDLDNARQKNISLQSQITANSNCERGEELDAKISTLEDRLKICQAEKEKLTKTIEEIETERDDEIKIIQDALEEAAQEREELIASFEKEFQNINSMNSNREQQLMEDFEWKLREIEKDHKKKLEEKDRMAEERLNAVRNLVESELADSITKVAEDRRAADEQMLEVSHLKSYEAEVIQLRGVTHELQKALRASAREIDRLKMREKILEEEVRGLKKAQPSRQNTMHRHKRQADDTEAEFQQKQEKMKNELNAEWEDKLRTECSRLKAELDNLHAEEKHLAVESMKVQKEQEIRTLKQSWELRQEEMTKEISTLKDSLTDKDAYYHKEMENLRTNADRDVWELRRKLQKLDEKNWTQQELLQEKHTEDMERLRQDFKERVGDLEARLVVTSRTSTEDERRQLEKMHNDELEHLCEQHRNSMERLREELECEKFQAVEEARVIVSQHLEHINASLKEQLLEATCSNTQFREELEAIRGALSLREEVISSLEEELAKVKSSHEGGASLYKASQSSIASSEDSNGSSNSNDRLSLSDSIDNPDEVQKAGGGSLLGKVFGGGWFSGSKGKESSRRGSAPSTDKKTSPSS